MSSDICPHGRVEIVGAAAPGEVIAASAEPVVEARVERVLVRPKNENTAIVTVSVPRDYAKAVRSIDWRSLADQKGEILNEARNNTRVDHL